MGEVVNKDSLVLKYFILPLYGITFDKIKEEYICSNTNLDGTKLYLQLKSLPISIENSSLYSGSILNGKYHILNIDGVFIDDLKKIVKGKYSQLSEVAIQKIISNSGLEYNRLHANGKSRVTSSLLLALKQHPEYKKYMEMSLGVDLTGSELISKLSKQAFIENIINQEL